MRQKLNYPDVQNFCLWFLPPRRAHSELCNQSGGEKYGQKGKRDWYFNKCINPYCVLLQHCPSAATRSNNNK
jgi:hypothetical protein